MNPQNRTTVVTGAASGIGRATKELLEADGQRVIGVDLHDAEITADLATAEGRASLPEQVAAASGGSIDAVIAVAGVSALTDLTVRVNYFGAVATLEGLRPLLVSSESPRAALVSSFSAVQAVDDELVAAMIEGDELAAIARTSAMIEADLSNLIYASTKRAISEWMRARSIEPEWAGAGIPLNGVGPGVVLTPMIRPFLETEEGRAMMSALVPMPLSGPAEPVVIARTLAFLTDPLNTHITGQTIFVDGGADVTERGAKVFGSQ